MNPFTLAILGGGPGGLYAALLAKRRFPHWDVRVYERNARDDTFGWGVVFSDETLGHFEEADPESYLEIQRRFVHWTEIDTWARGEVIRSTGHGFSGIARVALLDALASRCEALGVALHFRSEMTHDALPGADVIVAADGINSRTRAAMESVFEPNIEWGKAPFIWLGTDKVFNAFTFIFKENDHGTFQVHAYPFTDGDPRVGAARGTFIVETDEETFARAGLASMTEADSLAYLEALFSDELGGARLYSNKSSWIRFRHVQNRRWSAGNVVLIGDAAHTAHFSIGSGTKLAMEDAIALVDALGSELQQHQRDVPAALAAYERARSLETAKLQRTARVSQSWFERAGLMFRRMTPLQLVGSMMTRSRRVTHDNLRLRDPALVERLDRWFEAESGVAAAGDDRPPRPPMFTPFTLRGLTLENRVVVSPMCQYSATDGLPNDWHLVHLGSRAVGGAGLVMAEMTDVSADGRITLGCTGLYDDAHEAAWARIVAFVKAHSRAAIGIQLGHAGRKGATRLPWEPGRADEPLDAPWPLLAPSPIPYHPYSPVPRAMTRADMDRVLADFVAATHRAARAGFDLVEVHMAHGYLLSSFVTPISNQRDDEYGGSLENRMRFPLEVLRVVRAAWPAERPVSVRISAVDWAPGGLEADDAVAVARLLAESGCDLVDVSTGQTTPDARPEYGRMYQAPFANLIRHSVGIATLAVGAIADHDHVNTIIATGRADLCALARPHLADPVFTQRAAVLQGYDLAWPVQYLAGKPAT
jgi:anthraniloyl-CoA monooxygenase